MAESLASLLQGAVWAGPVHAHRAGGNRLDVDAAPPARDSGDVFLRDGRGVVLWADVVRSTRRFTVDSDDVPRFDARSGMTGTMTTGVHGMTVKGRHRLARFDRRGAFLVIGGLLHAVNRCQRTFVDPSPIGPMTDG